MSLGFIPFDVFFHLASFLNLDDIVHVCLTCPRLTLFLDESTICRKVIQTHVPTSREARLANAGAITYNQAVRLVYQRHQAFFYATPLSAWVAGQGTSFLCRQGVICVLHEDTLQLSYTHSRSGGYEISLKAILGYHVGRRHLKPQFSLLYLNDNIVTICYQDTTFGNLDARSLLAIDIRRHIPHHERLIRMIPIGNQRRLFVRHTSSFLCWGTRSGEGSSIHEWVIRITPMDPQAKEINEYSLPDFHGKDIGSTVAFEIHDGYFYALSNRTTFEVEEIDWTSFYVCVRFSLQMKKPLGLLVERTNLWRRQHTEGPIIDSWTNLSIQRDECTDKLFIVEGRREWRNGASGHARSFYATMVDPHNFVTDNGEAHPFPAKDPLVGLISPADNPHYAPEETRAPWQVHSEPQHGLDTVFPLSQTKFGAYNFASDIFIDVVEDRQCCVDPSTSCLRLRIGSRKPAPLWYNSSVVTDKGHLVDECAGVSLSDDQRTYRYAPIQYWPPPASHCPCSQRLHKLISPEDGTPVRNSIIKGALDEYSFVYMTQPRKSYDARDEVPGTVVVVNFCPDIPTKLGSNGRVEVANGDVCPSEWFWRRGRGEHCAKGEC